jgi:protein TonB
MTLGGASHGTVTGPLGPALAISIALHAALLTGLPDLWTGAEPPAPPPLVAHLVPGAVPAQAPDAAPVEPPKPPPALPAPPRGGTPPKPAPPVRTAPRPQRDATVPIAARRVPETVTAEPASVPGADAAAAPPTDARPSPPSESAALAGAPVPAWAGESLASVAPPGEVVSDPGLVAAYRLALIAAAKRQKRYPSRAIDLGWEGRVDVRLEVGADGEIARVLIERSSGHGLLDDQALELMRRAGALTPVPPALRGREFTVDVPVVYELRERG